jgi:hypothetical protein
MLKGMLKAKNKTISFQRYGKFEILYPFVTSLPLPPVPTPTRPSPSHYLSLIVNVKKRARSYAVMFGRYFYVTDSCQLSMFSGKVALRPVQRMGKRGRNDQCTVGHSKLCREK